MLAHVLCLLVLLSGSLAHREQVIIDGAFNYPFVVDEDIRQSADASTLYFSTKLRCARSFSLLVDVQEDSLVTVERISSVLADGEHGWTQHGEGLVSSGVELEIPMTGPVVACGSTWRFVIHNPKVTWTALSVDSFGPTNATSKKRETSCTFDAAVLYPPECSSASDGALCLSTSICGCKIDKDCFGNTDFPFCNLPAGATEGTCDRCTIIATPGAPNADHYFCRDRYPGFPTQPTDGSNLPNERAAPANYFREYCVRTPVASSGACQRCNQAPLITTLPAAWSLQSRQGASGTIHCNAIRPTTAPICMDLTYMTDTGGTFDANLRGACVPCTLNAQCARALPNTPICDVATGSCKKCATNADCGSLAPTLDTPNCQADGSCIKCASNANCGTLDGGEKPGQTQCGTGNGICTDPFTCTDNGSCVGQAGSNCQADRTCLTCTSNANCGTLDGGETPGQQVCNTGTGICGPCTDNAVCTGTTGANCQADGSCKTCTSDANCGALDGGSQPGQTKCDTALGICITPFSCTDNASCQPASTGGNNCQQNLSCVSCTGIATCGALDGGETPNQPNCNLSTRLCVAACTTNAACVGTQGNNCMNDGICRTCTINADCNIDGGERPNQSICDVPTGLCISPCAQNADCPAGSNCQASGSCLPCAGNNANCGALDGGETPGQPICQPSGICGPCTSNNDCKGNGKLSNCGKSGSCYDCSAPGNTCGAQDGPLGGPFADQAHCDEEIGLCVDYCTLDEHCLDSCAPHCNVQKGCCVECTSADHCPHDNWRGPMAELTGCSPQFGQCVPGCLYDNDCSGATAACDLSSRTCVECFNDAHCTDSENGPYCHTDENVCSGDSPYGSSSNGIAIAALVLAIIALVLVCILIIYVATMGGGHERV